jgi:DNA-binding response OmpR family regulator
VPKDELIDVVWPGLVVEENNLQVQISALRKVLGAQAIATVPGRGYRFTVSPGASPASTSGSTPASASAGATAGEAGGRIGAGHAGVGAPARSRLLVADDNKVNRLLLCRSLELMGHEVASVDNGRAALEKLQAERFDLLLLDLEMPELDGFGLLEQRAGEPALRDVPVIVTSSLEGAAAVARCIELGADDYLHKPVNPMLLKARVGATLERKHLRDRERELLARLAPGRENSGRAPGGAAAALRAEATVLVARLHGIDAPVSASSPHETIELLSSWTTLMVDAIEERGGRAELLAGDAVTAVFGVAVRPSAEGGAPWAATQAALEMVALTAQLGAERAAAAQASLRSAIGIASGEVVTGDAGTPRRAALVSVGAAVQRAARLEALAAESGRAIVVDASTHAALGGRVASEALRAASLGGGADVADADAAHALTTGA